MKLVYSPIYLGIVIFLIYSCFTKHFLINAYSVLLCTYLLFKWITDYRMCTISYLEFKIRGVPKESGVLYNFLEDLIDFNKCDVRYFLYICTICILIRNIYLLYNKKNKKI